MPRNLSTKYYQDNKERIQKKVSWKISVFPKKKKKKSSNMGLSNIKISRKMKNKNSLRIEKKIYIWKNKNAS